MVQTIPVVAAIFTDGDRVLACRRRAALASGGKWEFPGGKVEPGETAPTALVREIREELGVTVSVGELLDRSATVVDGRSIDLSCYFVSTRDPLRHSVDHDRLEWIHRTRLDELDWASPDEPAVHRLTTTPAEP